MAFELPALPYAYDALQPTIDEETMHLHHDKHHAAYVANLNAAVEKTPELQGQIHRRDHLQSRCRARFGQSRRAQQRRRSHQSHDVLGTDDARRRI